MNKFVHIIMHFQKSIAWSGQCNEKAVAHNMHLKQRVHSTFLSI